MAHSELDLQSLNNNALFTILVVEDMENIRAQLIADLRFLNFKGTILQADTLAKAKVSLAMNLPDLVICDRNLPDGSGVNLLQTIKENPEFNEIPFIMCTTVDEAKHVAYAITQGANEYITKPWTQELLAKKILSVISK